MGVVTELLCQLKERIAGGRRDGQECVGAGIKEAGDGRVRGEVGGWGGGISCLPATHLFWSNHLCVLVTQASTDLYQQARKEEAATEEEEEARGQGVDLQGQRASTG